jgi:hypothetical protein
MNGPSVKILVDVISKALRSVTLSIAVGARRFARKSRSLITDSWLTGRRWTRSSVASAPPTSAQRLKCLEQQANVRVVIDLPQIQPALMATSSLKKFLPMALYSEIFSNQISVMPMPERYSKPATSPSPACAKKL